MVYRYGIVKHTLGGAAGQRGAERGGGGDRGLAVRSARGAAELRDQDRGAGGQGNGLPDVGLLRQVGGGEVEFIEANKWVINQLYPFSDLWYLLSNVVFSVFLKLIVLSCKALNDL